MTRVTIIDFIIFLLFSNPSFFLRLARRCLPCCGRGSDVPLRRTTYRLSSLSLWTTVAKDICENVVLSGIILQRQGTQVDFWKMFVIFSIRPRGAFFHALLGFVDGGWADDGLVDMAAQILLSVFGGYMAFIAAWTADRSTDPSRPVWWKTYLAGGAIASVATDMLVVYLFVIFVCVCTCCVCWGAPAFVKLTKGPFAWAWKTLFGNPLKEVVALMGNVVRCVSRRGRVGWNRDDRVIGLGYYVCMGVSLVLFVGCWMFWNGYVILILFPRFSFGLEEAGDLLL
jgi:hypothetical protein